MFGAALSWRFTPRRFLVRQLQLSLCQRSTISAINTWEMKIRHARLSAFVRVAQTEKKKKINLISKAGCCFQLQIWSGTVSLYLHVPQQAAKSEIRRDPALCWPVLILLSCEKLKQSCTPTYAGLRVEQKESSLNILTKCSFYSFLEFLIIDCRSWAARRRAFKRPSLTGFGRISFLNESPQRFEMELFFVCADNDCWVWSFILHILQGYNGFIRQSGRQHTVVMLRTANQSYERALKRSFPHVWFHQFDWLSLVLEAWKVENSQTFDESFAATATDRTHNSVRQHTMSQVSTSGQWCWGWFHGMKGNTVCFAIY